nr:ribonuclease H-like domain-containing protein [Tanacetum cinerariifolium]
MEILLEPTSNKLLVANELTDAFGKPFEVLNNVFEHVAVCSSLRSLKPKHTIEFRAKRSSKMISLGHYSTILASSHTVKSKTDIKSPMHYPCGDPQDALKDTGIFDSGCSRHIIGNKSYLTDYQEYDKGFVAFAGSSKGGKITGKGKIRTGKLDFEDMYFVKELKFNLFSVSQMYDKKNSVLFTETECLILSFDFKLPDEIKYCLRSPERIICTVLT